MRRLKAAHRRESVVAQRISSAAEDSRCIATLPGSGPRTRIRAPSIRPPRPGPPAQRALLVVAALVVVAELLDQPEGKDDAPDQEEDLVDLHGTLQNDGGVNRCALPARCDC